MESPSRATILWPISPWARPVKGQKEFQLEWQGARWLFASREHLAMFQENPEKYAPQYGGY